jgi:hypothetical protein
MAYAKDIIVKLINECVADCLPVVNESLRTYHDENHNLSDKLRRLGIGYDYIGSGEEPIIDIETWDEDTKRKVKSLLNVYGWQVVKETDWCVTAERVYSALWNDYYDMEAEEDKDYPYGEGIYYHITTAQKAPKILRQGLTVREGNKLGFKRGQRTYLLSWPWREFGEALYRNSREPKVDLVILLVDLRKYLGKQINIYHDDFTDDDGAVYTYDYIPPDCLKIYDRFTVNGR